MALVVATLLGICAVVIVIYPLLGLDVVACPSSEAAAGPDVGGDSERVAKDALRDLEFDHRLGNLDTEDYQALRAHYERRALEALKSRYDQERELDAIIDARLAELRAGSAQSRRITRPAVRVQKSVVPKRASVATGNGHRSDASGPSARRRKGV